VMDLSPQLYIAPKGAASRIAIRAGKKILFIDSADIIAVEAEGHYVLLQHKSSGYLLRESISTMAQKLSLFGFVRIHRSSLVNAAFVEEIQPLSTGEYVLRVRGGKKYTVTSTYKKNLHLLAGSWIGTDGFDQIESGGLINGD
jgi:two-component system LytT family response regulator